MAQTATVNGHVFSMAKATLPNCCFTVCAFLDPNQTGGLSSDDFAVGYTKGKTTVATLTGVNGPRGLKMSMTMTWAQFLKKEGQ